MMKNHLKKKISIKKKLRRDMLIHYVVKEAKYQIMVFSEHREMDDDVAINDLI